jgi:hypothetical protein
LRSMRLLIVIGAALAAALLIVPLASADEGDIEVLSQEVISLFPDGINFYIAVQSSSPIDEIRVFYKSENTVTTSYGNLDFEPGERAEATFFLSTGSGTTQGIGSYVPPGAVFHFSFEVRDEAGSVLKTQEEEFVYIDPRFEWTAISEGPITVFHYGPTDKRAQTILESAVEAVANMARILGVEDVEPINIVAYNNYSHMITALPPRSQAVREGLITQGQAFTNIRVLLVLAFDEDFIGTTSHEVTHVIVDDAAGRAYSIIPAWLNEGLAEVGNILPNEAYDNALLFGVYTRRLKPLWYLRVFTGDPDDVVIAYGQSSSVASYLLNAYGEEKMAELLNQLGQTLSVDEALLRTYGFDQRGLDTEWRLQVGLKPFTDEELAEESPLANAVPTLSPTPAIEGIPQAATPTAVPREGEGDTTTSPGCNRGSSTTGSIPADPFIMLLLAGSIGVWPLRRLRRPKL